MAYKLQSGGTIIDDARNIVNAGVATISTILAGSATTTNTAGQALQVGSSASPNGAYISGSVGIGTTNPLQKLWVEGAGYFSGIASASQLVSNAAQGTAPISVGSSTLVSNLNAQYLNSQPGSFYQIANNLTGQAPGSVVTQSSGLTITGNLSVSGNVSVSGTSFLVSAQSLRITDRDITLGITTNALGDDVSTDTTANHGGIAIASTEGTPFLNIPPQAGINTDPSTYKQIMWIRQNNYSGMGTDAWVFNYGVSIGNTATLQNGSRLTVGAGFTVYDTYLDATDIRARNIPVVTNINASGIITSGNHNVTTGNSYQINGTSVLNATTLGSGVVNSSLTSVGTLGILNVTGATTSGSLSVTGIITSGNHNVTTGNSYQINGTSVLNATTLGSAVVNSSLTSVGTLTQLGVTGIVTAAGGFNASSSSDYEINGTSVLNSTTLGSGVVNSSLTSVGTLATLNATNITNTNINSSGIHSAATFNVGATTVLSTVSSQIRLAGIATIDATTKATLERELAFAPNQFDDLSVTGISTFSNGPVLIGTATSTGTAGQALQVGSSGATRGAYISGSVGIGTTNPQSPLDVNGNARFRSAIVDNNGATGSSNQILTAGPSGAGVTWATLNASTIGAISGINIVNDTATTTPLNLAFTSASSGSVTTLNVDTSGLTFIPSGAGSLGIGTTSPTRTLDVNGEIRLRAGLYDSTNALGSLNQVLTVGAGGSVTWQAVTSTGAISGINVSQDDTGIRYPLLAAGANATTTAQYVDATALVYNTSSNCLGIGSLTPTSRLDIIGDIRVSGIVTAGDFNSTSDRKLKTNIQPIINPIEKVLQISGVSFNWKETGKATMGVVAQEIETVLPELVSDTDPKTVNYNGLIGLLIECVKDQQKQIDELKQITAKKTTRKPKNT
jgi:hypothetical protein